MSLANEKQVGGKHYKGLEKYQHWDVVTALNWDYLVGAATKYLWRIGRKGDLAKSIEDVGKAIHYLEKKQELMRAELEASEEMLKMNVLNREYFRGMAAHDDDGSSPGVGYVNQDR